MIDVLGLGITAIDSLLYVDGYPSADSKTPARSGGRRVGGISAAALLAAARLGGQSAYAGMLGFDPLSEEMLAALRAGGVDVETVTRVEGAGPVESVVVVDTAGGTRTIFFDDRRPHGPPPDPLPETLIRSARVLLVDHHNPARLVPAVQTARQASIPVVADFERSDGEGFDALLAAADHLILSLRFAAGLTGKEDAGEITAALWHPGRALVAVTGGAEGAWYRTAAGVGAAHQPAFPVNAVDPTGCGDVFHGAYALRLAEGAPPADCIRFAAAAAALKAAQPGGPAGFPDREQVDNLLASESDPLTLA